MEGAATLAGERELTPGIHTKAVMSMERERIPGPTMERERESERERERERMEQHSHIFAHKLASESVCVCWVRG